MHIHQRTGKPLHKGIIETMAKLDAQLNLMDREDEDQLLQWLMEGGQDVSLVGRSLLVASFDPSHSLINTGKENT
jgi:hypothetical protein